MFELLTKTKAKIVDVVVLSQKNRDPDDNPGVKVSVEQALSNLVLAHFDGRLREMLYSKKPGAVTSGQQSLDGVEPVSDTPHLTTIGAKLGWFHWDFEGTGYTFVIDHGMGGSSNLELDDCTVSNLRLHCNEGGTVDARYDIESENASEKAFGRLAKLKSTEVDIQLLPPDVHQRDLDDAGPTAAAPAPKAKTPEEALAEAVAKPLPDPVKGWPFPVEPGGSGGPANKSAPAPAPAAAAKKVVSRRPQAGKQALPVKYRDPESGQTWSGRGLKPKWLSVALERGKTLADFATQ